MFSTLLGKNDRHDQRRRRYLAIAGVSVAFHCAWLVGLTPGTAWGWSIIASGMIGGFMLRSRHALVVVPAAMALPMLVYISIVVPLVGWTLPNPYWVGYAIGFVIVVWFVTSFGVGISMLARRLHTRIILRSG